jgi:hypothetical protein
MAAVYQTARVLSSHCLCVSVVNFPTEALKQPELN